MSELFPFLGLIEDEDEGGPDPSGNQPAFGNFEGFEPGLDQLCHLDDGELWTREGYESRHFFRVRSGELELRRGSRAVASLAAGDMGGIEALLGIPYGFSIRAIGPCCLELYRPALGDLGTLETVRPLLRALWKLQLQLTRRLETVGDSMPRDAPDSMTRDIESETNRGNGETKAGVVT